MYFLKNVNQSANVTYVLTVSAGELLVNDVAPSSCLRSLELDVGTIAGIVIALSSADSFGNIGMAADNFS